MLKVMVFVNDILIFKKNCLQGNICPFFSLHIALVVSVWFYDLANSKQILTVI